MHLKIPFTIKDRPWYPQSRPFTEFEARIDYLIRMNSGASVEPGVVAAIWRWSFEETEKLTALIKQTGFAEDDWIEHEPTPSEKKIRAQQVIDIYNTVFSKNIHLSPHRLRTINARFEEGRTLAPRVGLDQFKAVFEYKKKEWEGTEQEKYLEIETMCAAKHFLKYLDAARLAYRKKNNALKQNNDGVKIEGVMYKNPI